MKPIRFNLMLVIIWLIGIIYLSLMSDQVDWSVSIWFWIFFWCLFIALAIYHWKNK